MTSLRRRLLSAVPLLPRSNAPWLRLKGDLRPSSSNRAGERKGVEDPDSTSFPPLSPLCKRPLGAGSPLRKCSSSASVPLSLPGVESLWKNAGRER